LDKGKAYYCFCEEKTLEEMRQEQIAQKRAPKYDRRCLKLTPKEIKEKLDNAIPHAIRMKIPEGRLIEINDIVRGKVIYKSDELDDQVLLKADGYPTYHLAVVVDDHLMEISHVTRTEEWLPSTPKHILLYEYFSWEPPAWAHLPLLLNEDRTKMSKRKGDVALEDYIKKGYLPEALINYLAFLGWNPGSEKEIYSMEELLKDFKLEKVHKAGAVFNIEKLNWYNAHYIKKLPIDKLIELCQPYLVDRLENQKSKIKNQNDNSKLKIKEVIGIEQKRLEYLAQITDHAKFFFELPEYDKNLLKWKKMSDKDIKKSLEISQKIISEIPEKNFIAENLRKLLLTQAEKMGDRGELLWPLRVALSGQKNSPPPFEIAEILGKEESLERIEKAIRLLA
jgi:glutamyl-tRNA synthetase